MERYQTKLDQVQVSKQAMLWVDKIARCIIMQTKINSCVLLRVFGQKLPHIVVLKSLGLHFGLHLGLQEGWSVSGESKVKSLGDVSHLTEAVRISRRGF